MAEESVWIDLDEVQSSAKAIMGLLKELEGPANQLEAAVKQVQESVYGAELLGKSLQGSSSSVGGLGQHQEQVMAGIRVLMQNATAMGDNLLAMAARHEANDQLHAAELTRIGGTATTPALPVVAGMPSGAESPLRPLLLPDSDQPAIPAVEPITPPRPITPVSVPDAGVGYHDPAAPELHYNDNPDPLYESTVVY